MEYKKEEIRIGNWFFIDERNGEACLYQGTVEEISHLLRPTTCKIEIGPKEYKTCDLSHMIPIPITEQVLNSRGFSAPVNPGLFEIERTILVSNDERFNLKFDPQKEVFFVSAQSGEMKIENLEIKYVHELQNILADTHFSKRVDLNLKQERITNK